MANALHSQVGELRQLIQSHKSTGRTIGFVPTMGFLHRGHQSLIEASHRAGHFTIVSIFVNPTQFGPNEDFESYPRRPERDFELARSAGADLVWYPGVEDLYPPESQTMVTPGPLAECLCGLSRPQFFGGICTVVLKFFQIIHPNQSFFGEKDFQQLAIIKRMAADFMLDVEVVGAATVREPDGLAMSSRNAKLAPADRHLALSLFRMITAAMQAFAKGETDPQTLSTRLHQAWPTGIELDYLEFRHPESLERVTQLEPDTRIFLGAWLKGIRLIDNAALT